MKIKFQDFQSEARLRGPHYLKAMKKVLYNGTYILGPEVSKFESNFAKFLDVKYCIGVANGLEALQIALMSLGVGNGDEVITTPLSAVATTLAILAVGASPVFVDTDESGLINIDLIEEKLSKKTKAIIPVHLYGNSVDAIALMKLCKKNKIYLIEDAAQAHGSKIKNKMAGTIGQMGCFSFYPTKNLGCLGDGGAIVTNDSKLALRAKRIRDYGQSQKYVHTVYGLNSRLDEIQAALLTEKLKFLNSDNLIRNKIALSYHDHLKNVPEISIVDPQPDFYSCRHLMVIKAKNRNALQKYLLTKNIPTLIHYPILIPHQPLFKNEFRNSHTPTAEKIVKSILSLPSHPQLNEKQISFIANEIKHFYEK